MRPATDPPHPQPPIVTLSCSYLVGFHIGRGKTQLIVTRAGTVHVLSIGMLTFSSHFVILSDKCCLPTIARITGGHAGKIPSDRKKKSFLDHNSRLCLNSHLSVQPQPSSPGILPQDEGEHKHVYLVNVPLWSQEQVSFWWLAPLESIVLSTELHSGRTVK